MPNSITSTGLTTATQTELVSQLTLGLQSIFGIDINLSSSTPDGQMMMIFIQVALDLLDLLRQINSQFDPDQAIGALLDQRVSINGIQRQAGTYTITNLTIVTSQALTLPGLDQSVLPAYTVSDNSGNQWQLITSQTIGAAGTYVFAFRALNPGAITTTPNTISVPVSVVIGVISINNPTTYTTLGLNEETDAALRLRRQQSVSLSSQGYYNGLKAALLNINGLTYANIVENDTNGTSSDGVPSHSIWAIIAGSVSLPLGLAWNSTTSYSYGQIVSSGGVNYISWANNNLNNLVSNTAFWGVYNPIAQSIYSKRNGGCGMLGSQSYIVTQADGSPFIVYWDVVTPQNLFIKFTASSLDGINAPNISSIIASLVANFVPGVYQKVNINDLGTDVQDVDPNCLVTSAGFSLTSGGSYTNTLLPATKNLQFAVSGANIIILPIILSCPSGIPAINGTTGQVTTVNVTVPHTGTKQFAPLGGYGTMSYALTTNVSGGSVNGSSGLYTSGATPGTDVVTVTDGLGNTATATIGVT